MLLEKINKHTYIPNITDAIAVNKELENNPADNALQKLFTQLCPNNTSLEDILINVPRSTNYIARTFSMYFRWLNISFR